MRSCIHFSRFFSFVYCSNRGGSIRHNFIIPCQVVNLGYLDQVLFFFSINFVVVILIFWFLTLLGSMFLKKKEYKIKNEYYECGFISNSDFSFKLNVGTFITMLLVIFYDVELVFIVPFLINSHRNVVYFYESVFFFYICIFITFLIDIYEGVISWDF